MKRKRSKFTKQANLNSAAIKYSLKNAIFAKVTISTL